MPSKRTLRRLRLLRATAWAAVLAGLMGVSVLVSATPDALHHERDGLLGIGLGLVVAIAGVAAVVWCLRAEGRVGEREMAGLTGRGEDDQLPYGAYRQGERVGPEASDQWLLFAGLMTVIGLGFLVAGIFDARIGVKPSLAFSLVGFIPALIFLRLGMGTPYWLTEDGLVTRGPFRREIAWTEVERIRLSHKGSSVSDIHLADAIELQVAADTPLRWGALGITTRLGFLEIAGDELLALLQPRCPTAHIIR